MYVGSHCEVNEIRTKVGMKERGEPMLNLTWVNMGALVCVRVYCILNSKQGFSQRKKEKI